MCTLRVHLNHLQIENAIVYFMLVKTFLWTNVTYCSKRKWFLLASNYRNNGNNNIYYISSDRDNTYENYNNYFNSGIHSGTNNNYYFNTTNVKNDSVSSNAFNYNSAPIQSELFSLLKYCFVFQFILLCNCITISGTSSISSQIKQSKQISKWQIVFQWTVLQM